MCEYVAYNHCHLSSEFIPRAHSCVSPIIVLPQSYLDLHNCVDVCVDVDVFFRTVSTYSRNLIENGELIVSFC